MRLRITSCAQFEILDIAEYIGASNYDAGLRFFDAAYTTIRLIADYPEMMAVADLPRDLGAVRRMPITEFPAYLIFYRIVDEVIEIGRVLHGARDVPAILTADVASDAPDVPTGD